MDLWLAMLLLIFVMLVLLFAGVEIAVVLGMTGLIGCIFIIQHPATESARLTWDMLNSYVLTAVPLFIFMGSVFVRSGVANRLFTGAMKLAGWLPGGLYCSIVVACSIFAAISGSSPATAATIGTIAIPEMERRGFNMTMTMGTVAAGGTLGILIPPSINMIVYASWETISVLDLFAAGISTGVTLAALFIIGIVVVSRLKPSLAPKIPQFTFKERLTAAIDIAPFAIVIVLILGIIFAGVVTPTEAAAMGAFLSMLVALIYRRLSFKLLKECAMETLVLTCMIMFIVAAAQIVAFVLHYQRLGVLLVDVLMSAHLSRYFVLAIIIMMYLILGMFLEPMSMMLMTLPIVVPIMEAFGFDLVWFGVVLVLVSEAGMITPPVGMNLYILQGVAPKYGILQVSKGAAPFLIPIIAVVVLLAAFPQIALWLPSKI